MKRVDQKKTVLSLVAVQVRYVGNFVLLLAALGIGSLSFAGTSDEDPVVSSLRTQYESAIAPTLADLEPGQTWSCREFHAITGNFTQTGPFDVIFKSYGGNLVEMRTSASTDVLAISANAAVGVIRSSAQKVYFRFSTNGDLIGELLLRPDQVYAGESSISDPSLNAFTYITCPAIVTSTTDPSAVETAPDSQGSPAPTPLRAPTPIAPLTK